MTQSQDSKTSANSGGGTQIEGDVHTKTFVGRDQHIHFGPLKISKYLLWAILAVILLIIIISIRNTFLLGDIRDVDIATPTVTPTATSTTTPTPTLTPTLTATDTPLPTSTPLPVQPAIDDETLILITNFYLAEGIDDSEAHHQIAQAIEEQIQANSLENVRVGIDPNVILRESEQEHARRIAEQYNASIIIWGDETSVKFTVNFLNLRQPTFKAADVTINADHTSVHKAALADPEPYIRFVTKDLPDQLSFLSLFAMGQTEYNQGNYERAVVIIEQAVEPVKDKRVEGLSAAYFRLGWLYQFLLEQLEQAIAYYDQATALDSDYAFAYNNRGLAYHDLGKYEQAIADYDQAIALDSDYALAYYNRGNAYYDLGDYEKAIADYDQSIALYLNFAFAYNNRGIAYYDLGEYEKAITDYDQAITLIPDFAFAYNNRGLAYDDLGEYEKAIMDYDQAITLDPDFATAHVGRGLVYDDLGKYEKAILDYDQAIALDPDFALAYNSKCWLHSLWQEPEKALPYCEKAISKASEADKPTFRDGRGLAYALLGETEKAIADFQFYVEAFTENPSKAQYVAKRKIWIESLQAGENPFAPEVLEELRQE